MLKTSQNHCFMLKTSPTHPGVYPSYSTLVYTPPTPPWVCAPCTHPGYVHPVPTLGMCYPLLYHPGYVLPATVLPWVCTSPHTLGMYLSPTTLGIPTILLHCRTAPLLHHAGGMELWAQEGERAWVEASLPS